MSMEFESDDEKLEDKVLNGEYRIWKKNTPFLYDTVLSHSLEWPTLTVEWIDSMEKQFDPTSPQRLVFGTHTAPGEQNYLLVANVRFPEPNMGSQLSLSGTSRGKAGYGGLMNKVQIVTRIPHYGDVHRARAMPQNNNMIATRSPFPEVCIFNLAKHSATPKDNTSRPQHRLHGHTSEGYGVSWSPFIQGLILSGSDDASVCIWDTNEGGLEINALQIKKDGTGHSSGVQDVAWSLFDASKYATVGDDSRLLIWDLRKQQYVDQANNAHTGNVNCLSFNPYNEHQIATGGGDGLVNIWDLRKLNKPQNTLHGHSGGVYQVSFAPYDRNILASSGIDRRIFIWDLGVHTDKSTEKGSKKRSNDEDLISSELKFIHGGHTGKISDFSWCKNKPNTIASVAEDNIMQIWQMVEDEAKTTV